MELEQSQVLQLHLLCGHIKSAVSDEYGNIPGYLELQLFQHSQLLWRNKGLLCLFGREIPFFTLAPLTLYFVFVT